MEESSVGRGRVVGLRSSAGPLRDVAVEFGIGVTALYGRNGAGKSWFLKALREAFHGRAVPRTHLIVEAPAGTAADEWVSWELGRRSLAEGWWDADDIASHRTTAIREWFTRGGRHYQPAENSPRITEGLVEELATSRYFALVPTGVTEPRWDVWICGDPDPLTNPVTTTAITRLANIERVSLAIMDLLFDAQGGEIPPAGAIMELGGLSSELQHAQGGTRPFHFNVEMVDAIGAAVSSTLRAAEAAPEKLEEAAELALQPLLDLWPAFEGQLNWLTEVAAGWLWDQEAVWDGPWHSRLMWDSGKILRPILEDGLPVPMVRVAEARSIPWVLHDETPETDIDRLTVQRFAAAMASQMGSPSDPVGITPFLERWVEALSDDANRIFGSLLQDGPQLTLQLARPYEWVIAPPLHWSTTTELSPVDPRKRQTITVPVSDLSTAERRWAHVAIRRALDRLPDPTANRGDGELSEVQEALKDGEWPPEGQRYQAADLVLLDEPEAALHRAAERHMAVGLDGLSVAGPQVVVATHSPEILNRPEVTLVHVRRTGSGATTTSQLRQVDLEASMEDLGMLPSDLIGMYRVFLLVEGEHDEILVRTFLPDVLEDARVKIVAMRGGGRLPSTIESQVLFDMTTAHLVALLDDVNATEVDTVWQEAQERYLTESADDAIDYLDTWRKEKAKMLPRKSGDEYQWITQWLSRALKKGARERFVPYGLAARDIIEYLPVEIIAPKAHKSWEELRAEHDAAKPNLNKEKHDFKRWLQSAYKADVSPRNVRRAAAVTEIPDEFQKLGYTLRKISTP